MLPGESVNGFGEAAGAAVASPGRGRGGNAQARFRTSCQHRRPCPQRWLPVHLGPGSDDARGALRCRPRARRAARRRARGGAYGRTKSRCWASAPCLPSGRPPKQGPVCALHVRSYRLGPLAAGGPGRGWTGPRAMWAASVAARVTVAPRASWWHRGCHGGAAGHGVAAPASVAGGVGGRAPGSRWSWSRWPPLVPPAPPVVPSAAPPAVATATTSATALLEPAVAISS